MDCPICGEELDLLDTVTNMITGKVEYCLYVYHNSRCSGENIIYNDRTGYLQEGDPTGFYK